MAGVMNDGGWIPSGEVIRRGAEAIIVRGEWFGRIAIYKARTKKAYRHEVLDSKIRRERTVLEARVLKNLLVNTIPVPCLFEVDLGRALIVMECIDGHRVKDLLENGKVDVPSLFSEIGHHVCRMHEMDIIHGDLTTSNIIATLAGNGEVSKVTFIDFGLADYSTNIEDRAVDIHLFKRVVLATHAPLFDEIFSSFLAGYRACLEGSGKVCLLDQIEARMEDIEARGRYVKKERRK